MDESGTVFVRTADGEREVGSYPGASHAEALGYFTRKYDELLASADLLLQRVTHTDLPAREGSEGLAKLREQTTDAHVVGDLAALDARVAQIAAAVEAKKATEGAERSAAREAGKAKREELVSRGRDDRRSAGGQDPVEDQRHAHAGAARRVEVPATDRPQAGPGVRDRPLAALQRGSQLLRQGPAGSLRPARGHPVRGQVSQGEAGQGGRGARTRARTGPRQRRRSNG